MLNPQINIDKDDEVKDVLYKQKLGLILSIHGNFYFFLNIKERIFDKTAFGRSFTLNRIKELVNQNLIPAECLCSIFKDVCGRIKDNSSFVRKASLSLFKSILKY